MQEKNAFRLINKYRSAIMGVAALWILFFHEWIPTLEEGSVAYEIECFVKQIGFCGVDFFLFLSGMGLVYAIQKYNVFTFYKRRLLRVFIPFLVIAVAMAIVQDWSLATWAGNLFGVNFYTKSIYSFLWFGPAIFTIYLLFPLYYYFFAKAPSKYQFTLGALLVWMALSIGASDIMREDLYGFTNRIPVFLVGVLAGWIVQEQEVIFTKLTWGLCGLMFLAGLYLAHMTGNEDYFLLVPISNCCVPNFLLATSGSFLLAKLFQLIDIHLRLFGKGVLKFFGFFGTLSLELYCVQEWVGSLIMQRMMDRYSNMTINLAVYAGVIIACIALWAVYKLLRMLLELPSKLSQRTSKM